MREGEGLGRWMEMIMKCEKMWDEDPGWGEWDIEGQG
jgi:hypothetical protein